MESQSASQARAVVERAGVELKTLFSFLLLNNHLSPSSDGILVELHCLAGFYFYIGKTERD